jgi:PAS domain S-box-containing protein
MPDPSHLQKNNSAPIEAAALEQLSAERLQELETLLDNLPVAVWIARDPKCLTITGNIYANRLLGVQSGDNISRSATQEDTAVAYKVLKNNQEVKPQELPAQLAAATGKTIPPAEFELVFPDGRILSMIISAKPLIAADGSCRGSITFGTDITERKQAENLLKQNEQKYRKLFSNMSEGFALCEIITDSHDKPVDYRLLEVNQSWEKLTGLTAAPLIGKPFKEMIPDLEQYWIDNYGKVALTGQPLHLENYNKFTDNWYEVSAFSPQEGYFVSLIQNITERKKVENALKESEERFHSVLDNSLDVIYRFNIKTGSYEYMSPSIRMMGFEPEEMIAMTNAEVFSRVHPDDMPALQKGLSVLAEKGSGYAEYRFLGKDGIYRWWANQFVLTYDPNGDPHYRDGYVRDITARKQTEEDLKQRELRFRTLIENLHSAVALIDNHGKFNTVNSAFLKTFGLSPESTILNVNSQDWGAWQVYEEDGKTLLSVDEHPVRKAVLKDQHSKNRLVGVKPPSSVNLIWLMITTEPIYSPDGTLQYVIVTYFDMTERKLAEEAAQIAQQQLQELIDGAPNFIFVKDLSGRFITINSQLEKLLGTTDQEIKGKTDYDVITREIADIYLENDRKVAQTDRAWQFEEEALLADGINHFLIANKFPLHDIDGKVDAVASISTDVTMLKQVQNELRASEKILIESQIVGRMGNWEWNIQTGGLKWSPGLYVIYGVDPASFAPTVNSFQDFIHPDDKELVDKRITSILSGKSGNFEFRVILPDGSLRVIETTVEISQRDEQNHPILVVGVNHDITERKQAEDALKQYTRELETYRNNLEDLVDQRTQELESLSRRLIFMQEEERRNISRELHDQTGQSLTVLNLLLAKALRSPDTCLADIKEAQKSVKEVLSQVRNLSTSLHPGMLEDLGLLPTLQWYFNDFGKRTDINVSFTYPETLGKLPDNFNINIYRIIQEALTNVARYAEVKEAAVTLKSETHTFSLCVEDKGKGFDIESLSHGVGLRGIRERVRSLKGNLNIHSVPGAGTRVEVQFPYPGG